MGSLTPLLTDTRTLLRAPAAPYLLLALVCQVLFWYLGSPGPALAGAPRSPGTALAMVGWAVLLLLAVPLAALVVRGDLRRLVGFGLGDWRFGLPATLLLSLLATAGMYVGASLPEVQSAYPHPGPWAGASLANLLGWIAVYALYYVAYEFFYRGFVLRTLERAWGLAPAVWVQTAASTLIHLGAPLAETLAAIPFGLLFAMLAIRGRSLLWPILLHLVIGVATDVFSLHHQGLLTP